MTAFRTMTTRIATASIVSPIAKATTVAATSRSTIRLRNWAAKIARGDRPGVSARALGPCCRSLRAASASVSPPPASVRSRAATSATVSVCQASRSAAGGAGSSTEVGLGMPGCGVFMDAILRPATASHKGSAPRA